MVDNRQVATGILAVAVIIAFIALFAPWWTMKVTEPGTSQSFSAGPFDTGSILLQDMISSGSAVLTGLLTLFGLLALLGAIGMLVYGFVMRKDDAVTKSAPFVALGGAVLVAGAIVLAIFMYPSEMNNLAFGMDVSFWKSETVEGAGVSFFAAWGWYMGSAAALLGLVGGSMAMVRQPQTTGAPAPVAPQ